MASPDRRAFLKTLAAASVATAASSRRVLGANDRVRVGFIGIGLIGKRHLLDFQAQSDCEIAGISEVSDERMDDGVAAAGNSPARFPDFRKMLEQPDIDAIVVSTPDHWHALMTILACAAGKDVYVEKPLTHVHREGEWMLDAATTHKRIVQVGTQQRSGRHYQRARTLIRDGQIGDVRGASIGAFRNITPGFTTPVGSPLSPAQWDMWLGPAPQSALRPGTQPLPLPLVQRLLRRPDHEPAGSRDRYRAVGHGRDSGAGRRLRAAPFAHGLRGNA